MYDIHCHILPDLDDGPPSTEEALAMARMAEHDGVRLVVATPHDLDVAKRGGVDIMTERLRMFSQEMAQAGINLPIVAGTECRMVPDLPEMAARGEVLPLNGSRYILVELDFFQFPPYTYDVLFRLQVGGLIPVLAHPERQATIQRDPTLAEQLVSRGVLMQVTGGSLLGPFGRRARECARGMLQQGLVHFVSSDAHSPSGVRTPVLSPVLEELQKRAGEEVARLLLVDNPRAVVENRDVVRPPAAPSRPLLGKRWSH